MNESENYLDQLLNAVDGRSDLNEIGRAHV